MFALYENAEKVNSWNFCCEVSIAGTLVQSMEDTAEQLAPKHGEAMPWTLAGNDFSAAVKQAYIPGEASPPKHFKLIIDATWGRDDALLLEIANVWGYAYETWCPLLLQMIHVAEGDRPNGRKTPLPHFSVAIPRTADQQYVHEFLYLQCGYSKTVKNRRRSWGLMGYTNAALLYPDAFAYLLRQVGFVKAVAKAQ